VSGSGPEGDALRPGSESEALLARLERRVRTYGPRRSLVALSGGVDSSVVSALASRALGRDSVTAVTAVSPSFPAGELETARRVAQDLGVRHRVIETREVEREAYARNDLQRCFHCKAELYAALVRLAAREATARMSVMAGANADDVGDFRPGQRAADRHGIRNPLLEEGVAKAEVRALARRLSLSVAEKPALACLSSRVAYGIRITSGLLARIDRAEAQVRQLGFDPVRVRHLGRMASIEVAPPQVKRLLAHSDFPKLAGSLRRMGWGRVEVDPRGYRTGSLNPIASMPGATR
jgi:uncharacterized protein